MKINVARVQILRSNVTHKNIKVNILMTNVIDVGLGGFLFWCFGYGLAFGDNP